MDQNTERIVTAIRERPTTVIKRERVPLFNGTNQNIAAIPNYVSGTPIIEKASDYSVVVETAAIDLRNAALDTRPDYEVMIFCELKDDTVPVKPPGLVYGPNYFRFPGVLTSVGQLLLWLYEILHKKALPFDLGNISLNGGDNFELMISNSTYTGSYANDYFRVYFNEPLAAVLEELCDPGAVIEAGGKLFAPMFTNEGTYRQTVNTLERLCKIESIILKTSLTVTKSGNANPNTGIVERDQILGTIEFNAGQYDLRAKTDWRYIPSVFRHTTLEGAAPIQSFNIPIFIRYTHGDNIAHVLSPGERANVNVSFYPRGGGF